MKKLLNIFWILLSVIVVISCGGDEDREDEHVAPKPITYFVSATTSGCGQVLVNDKKLTSALEVEKGTEVKFEAIADEGYYFEKWTNEGREVSINNPYKIVVLSDIVYTAVFKEKEAEKVTITAFASNGGIAEVNGKSSVDVEQGSNVTLVAKPNEGYEFINWTIDDVEVSVEREFLVKAVENIAYKANFAKIKELTISVEATEGGKANVNGAISVVKKTGEFVNLSAVANEGYTFVNWTLEDKVISTESYVEVKVVDNAIYKANFVKIEKVKIDVKATDGGEATVNGNASVEKLVGESVVLTAIPSEGYDFVNWTLNGAEVSTEKVFEVKVVASAEYVANFVKKIVNYVVRVESSEGGVAKVNDKFSVEVEEGTSVALTAVANEGYDFINWTANGVEVSTSSSFKATVNSAIIYKANFAKKIVKCTVYAEASEGGTATVNGKSSVEVEEGTSVTFTATANEGYEFVNWTANGVEVSQSIAFQATVNTSNSYKANFVKKGVKYTISVESGNGGTATVNGKSSVEVEGGESVTLSAIPTEGYDFVNWTANGLEISKSIAFQVTVSSAITYKANFVKKGVKYTVSVESGNGGSATVNGKSSVEVEGGESVTLSAIPTEGYDFVNWTANGVEVSKSIAFQATVSSAITYKANFVKKAVKYTVSVESSVGGKATVNGKISIDIEEGTSVTFTATANEGYDFVNWTANGKEVSSSATFQATVNSAISYKANFVKKIVKYTVSVESGNGGTATVNGKSSVEVEEGTSVTFTATANEGYDFLNWTANGKEVSTSATFQATANSAISYKANFAKKAVKYTVSVESGNGGTATVNGKSSVEVEEGTSVTLTAVANNGYEFVNWTANGVEVSTSASFQATVNSAVTYKANFAKKIVKYTVSVESGNGGSATVNGKSSVEVEEGTSVTLTAVANNGYEFVNWTANGVEVSTSASFQATVNSAVTYKANFAKKIVKYTVSVESGNGGSATVNGKSSVEVEEGTSVTLTAVANNGYEFVNWTANGVEVSTSASFQATVNSAVTYKANFAKDIVDTPAEILNLIDMNYISSIYVSSELVSTELWNAVINYTNGMNSVPNLVLSTSSAAAASNITYKNIVDVFIPRLNMITGKKFRLPTTSEMSVVASSVKFASPVKYVWCSNYKDEVNLYSSNPDSPDIPVDPSYRLVYSQNGTTMSISMNYKNQTIGLVLISDNY